MSQNDFDIADQTASSARADINNALQALASLSSLSTAPTTPYANMLWYDTGTNILKMRNEANSDWINVAYLAQGSSAFRILDDTQVTNTSGTQTGLLGDQATATWEAGSGTTESLVSPAKVKAAIDALVSSGFGVGQSWQIVTRSSGVWYQNTTGKPIGVYGYGSIGGGVSWDVGPSISEYTTISMSDGDSGDSADYGWIVVPTDHYYRNTVVWNNPRELR